MIEDYKLWHLEPHEKPSSSSSSSSLYEMISKAQHEHLKEFKYLDGGKEVTVKLEKVFHRPPEMLYGERWI